MKKESPDSEVAVLTGDNEGLSLGGNGSATRPEELCARADNDWADENGVFIGGGKC